MVTNLLYFLRIFRYAILDPFSCGSCRSIMQFLRSFYRDICGTNVLADQTVIHSADVFVVLCPIRCGFSKIPKSLAIDPSRWDKCWIVHGSNAICAKNECFCRLIKCYLSARDYHLLFVCIYWVYLESHTQFEQLLISDIFLWKKTSSDLWKNKHAFITPKWDSLFWFQQRSR